MLIWYSVAGTYPMLYRLNTHCYGKMSTEGHQFFPPSKQLLQVVQKYMNLFLKPSISIAVMIRSEHVLFSLGYLKQNKTLLHQTTTKAFNNLIATVRKPQANTRHGNIFVTADIGKYRSNTWHDTVKGWDKNLTSGVLENKNTH